MEENRTWRAKWIWHQAAPQPNGAMSHEIVYFRRTFDIPQNGNYSLKVDVSADSRYRLYLNGESVSFGPCKGERFTHYYETVDLSDKLRPGRNVLAAKVVHFRKSEPWQHTGSGPVSVWRSASGAFLLEGALLNSDGKEVQRLDTDQKWKCRADQAIDFPPPRLAWWLDVFERVEGSALPHGWERPDFDDAHWDAAVPFFETSNSYGELSPWQLTPRPIPQMYETTQAFTAITRTSNMWKTPNDADSDVESDPFQIDPAPLLAGEYVTLSPGTRSWIELDAGYLTTGYLSISFQGGKGSRVRLLGSECYEEPPQNGKRSKGVRDKLDGTVLVGETDEYRVAGVGTVGQDETYEPFWFRTFRFVRLEVEVGDDPLTIGRFHYRETGYPLEAKAEFQSSDNDLNQLWDISLNTLRRCMHETYEDCPYYEQLQYTMDTRLQMLFTYHVSADDRLARRTIYDYHSSMLPSGMLQSRYPSNYHQVIPGFSLYWIMMIDDHYRYFGDMSLIERYRPTILALLDWWKRRVGQDGLVGQTPRAYWPHIDWVKEWEEYHGSPPAGATGPLTMHSMMYAYALELAANLFETTGWNDAANEFRDRRSRVIEAVQKHCWSEKLQYFTDGPHVDDCSQHAQLWSILSGVVTDREEALALLERSMKDSSLPVISLPATHFLFRALEKLGEYEASFTHWDRWRQMLGLNLTTTPEIAHDSPRSDCHAWSALPLGEFPSSILGVTPGAPGFERIRIAPHPGRLSWAKGSVATKHGLVQVAWRMEDGVFTIEGEGPRGIPIDLYLPGGETKSIQEGGAFKASA